MKLDRLLSACRSIAAAALLTLAAFAADAASVPQFTGPSGTNPGPNPLNLNDVNQAINAVNQQVNSSTAAPPLNFRNWLDNGAMDVAVRGSGQINCGGTTGTGSGASLGAGYVADRWACIVNVTSQAGKVQVSTTTPPAGFGQFSQIIRNSGALTQPVTALQEIQTTDSVKLQGQSMVLSCWMQALAGLAADNSNAAQLIAITGTGTDQGLGTLTASPAITPAWTGVATPLNQTITIGTSWQRYVSAPFTVGSTVTEVAAGVGFTPTATGAGATDGFNFTGCQLEAAPPNCIAATTPVTTTTALGTCASPFEYRPLQVELAKGQRYYYVYTEVASQTPPFSGNCRATNTPTFSVPFPQQMRAIPSTPTSGNSQVLTVGSIQVTPNAGSAAGLTGITVGTHTVNFGLIVGTNTCATTTPTIQVVTTATTGILPFSADF